MRGGSRSKGFCTDKVSIPLRDALITVDKLWDIGEGARRGAFINTTTASSLFALNHTSNKSRELVLQLIKTIRRHTSSLASENVVSTAATYQHFFLPRKSQGLIYDDINDEPVILLKHMEIISKLNLKSMINFHKSGVIY